MKLGAQLFSVRKKLQCEEDIRSTFKTIKDIGYENVQLSGACPMDANILREISEENALPIVCTHSPLDRIIGDTDALIAEHKIFGCSVIGLGAMKKELRSSYEGLKEFFALLEEPVKKIQDAGLNFAYHNHAFEFDILNDGVSKAYDIMLETCESWHFILDTYWVSFAKHDPIEYIHKVGAKRLKNIHFKDLAKNEERSICACGDGVLDFSAIYEACVEEGVKNVLVEQDNAVEAPDMFAEMAKSFSHLRPIVK